MRLLYSRVLIGIRWMHYVSWYFYGWEALAVNQWDGVKGIKCTVPFGCLDKGSQILDFFELDSVSVQI